MEYDLNLSEVCKPNSSIHTECALASQTVLPEMFLACRLPCDAPCSGETLWAKSTLCQLSLGALSRSSFSQDSGWSMETAARTAASFSVLCLHFRTLADRALSSPALFPLLGKGYGLDGHCQVLLFPHLPGYQSEGFKSRIPTKLYALNNC